MRCPAVLLLWRRPGAPHVVRYSCFACFSNQIEADLGVLRTQVFIFAPPTRLTLSSSNDMHLPRAAKLQALRH